MDGEPAVVVVVAVLGHAETWLLGGLALLGLHLPLEAVDDVLSEQLLLVQLRLGWLVLLGAALALVRLHHTAGATPLSARAHRAVTLVGVAHGRCGRDDVKVGVVGDLLRTLVTHGVPVGAGAGRHLGDGVRRGRPSRRSQELGAARDVRRVQLALHLEVRRLALRDDVVVAHDGRVAVVADEGLADVHHHVHPHPVSGGRLQTYGQHTPHLMRGLHHWKIEM